MYKSYRLTRMTQAFYVVETYYSQSFELLLIVTSFEIKLIAEKKNQRLAKIERNKKKEKKKFCVTFEQK